MLSDEEKKAMKYFYNLRATIDESNMLFDENINVKCGKETIKQITIILNLIEKQSKEIEELKKEYERVRAGRNWLSEHISAQIATPELFYKLVEENYISKDKIKAEIEELDNQKRQWIEDRDNKHKDSEIIYAIEVLQSLLEKE